MQTTRRIVRSNAACVWLLLSVVIGGCGGGDSATGGAVLGEGDGEETADPEELARDVRELVTGEHGLTGDPAPEHDQLVPDDNDLVHLGQLLFFSRTLSAEVDVACASCHHPHLGGGDALSLPVGVAAKEPHRLGPGRELDPERDRDPRNDGGPNVPRNSQTVFNSALYNRALFHDGRVFVTEDEEQPEGAGQAMQTPESGQTADSNAGDTLLETQARFPLVSNREMRNFRYSDLTDPQAYREHLLGRLLGTNEPELLSDEGPDNWASLFEDVFGSPPEGEAPFGLGEVKKALAAYQRSKIFVDTPWKAFIEGEDEALSEKALRGAALFYTPLENDGLGCVACHKGDRFTDERFYNLGFPQIGRGLRIDGSDRGRRDVTHDDGKRFSFRTPSLLNIAERGPWGHAGTFGELEDLLYYHADPDREVEAFFSGNKFSKLAQFHGEDIDVRYSEARDLTEQALAAESFQAAAQYLPERSLNEGEVLELKAFLEALTDDCVASNDCLDQWIPQPDEDPDGNMLVRDQEAISEPVDDPPEETYPDTFALDYPEHDEERVTFPELTEDCQDANTLGTADNSGQGFVQKDVQALGLKDPHGWDNSTWFADVTGSEEVTMFAGGVTATWLDQGCWPGLILAGGDESGIVLYENLGNQSGFEKKTSAFTQTPSGRYTGVAHVDLNGDYRRELFFANLMPGDVEIFGLNEDGLYKKLVELPMSRSTFGVSFGDINASGYPDFYLAHWSLVGLPGTAPVLWKNADGSELRPYDEEAGTTSADVDQKFNFTPIFADMTGNSRQDLLVASDFETSQTLQNVDDDGQVRFENVTNSDVISDENGMGAVIGDFTNSGRLDWFVNSIFDDSEEAAGNWGMSGNRYYRNISSPDALAFQDATDEVGSSLRDGNWGWGTCTADFNNNGFLDIFHLNGFGYIPEEVVETDAQQDRKNRFDSATEEEFQGQPPRLFINNGNGTFTERAAEWGIDVPSEGLGVACFDYDRDGDIDIALLDQSSGIQFFENRTGHGSGHRFLNIRLVGNVPNTDALGARVRVKAPVHENGENETMLRLSQANSNFNGQNLPDLHFGLGYAEEAIWIEVEWPGGGTLKCENVSSNQFVVLEEDQEVCPE